MTKQEAWVRFVAGAMGDLDATVADAVRRADKALDAMLARWPETEGDAPRRAEEGATREG